MRPVVQKEILRRLSLIEGQVRGVRSMIEDERDLEEILALFTAIDRAASATRAICIADGLATQVPHTPASPATIEVHYNNILALIKKI